MTTTMKLSRQVVWTLAAVLGVATAVADVRPPVRITLVPGGEPAANGQVHEGTFQIEIGIGGILSDFQLRGEGWTIVSAEFPEDGVLAKPGTILVPFQAIPSDADAPLTLRCRHDGHLAKRSLEMGPRAQERLSRPRLTRVIVPGSTVQPADEMSTDEQGNPPGSGTRGGAIPLRFYGRFVYQRGDGQIVGADNIRVWVFDDDGLASDPLVDEIIWEGKTDQNGYFDSGVIMWDDCDVVGCDDPDIYVHFECDTEIAQVQESGVGEEDYFWRTMDNIIEDFTGTEVNFGTLAPADHAEDPAVHIWNSIIRAHRFIQDVSGIDLPIVDVQWPESGNGAYYNPFYEEIHISPDREWNEGTHTHEYGHHFLENRAVNPSPDYCNGFCDGSTAGCDFDADCPDEGHCQWCPETDHDAFNEGWPNWLADVVTRDYANRYTFEDGSPFTALVPRPLENLDVCCADNMSYDPTLTEGFVGALMRDIEDGTQDDHDGDGIMDIMCLGSEEIFYVVDTYEPVTVLDFITAFRTEYPQHRGDLWATAFNVGGAAYVAGFPADTTPPGTVDFMDSSTHPLGMGGSLPCIRFQFNRAPDTGTGATTYSYQATTNPAGIEPDETGEWVGGADGCQLEGTVPIFALGEYYISIKARDNAGNWSSSYTTFGPFAIIDCNGSGFLDACDLNCCGAGCDVVGPDWCTAGAGLCPPGACGISVDCNGNGIPDECDLANGTSEDCNGDGIPDECQPTLKHYTGLANTPPSSPPADPSDWADPRNWLDLDTPSNGDMVCVPADIPALAVVFHEDSLNLGSLSCEVDFTMNGATSPWPDLELTGPSFILGDLSMSGNSTLHNSSNLYVDGALNWSGGVMRNNGTTTVDGGLNLTGSTPQLWLSHHLIISGGVGNANTRSMTLTGGSELTIGLGVTYTYSGNFRIFDGGPTTPIHVNGVLERTSAPGSHVTNYAFLDNAGLVHNQVGELTLAYGGLHSGILLSEPGTVLHISGGQTFLPSSSLAVDEIELASGNCTIRGAVNIGGRLFNNGAVSTFAAEADVASYGNDLFARAGTLRFESPAPVSYPSVQIGEGNNGCTVYFDTGQPASVDTLSLINGTIDGDDPITINTSLTWLNGRFLSGGAVTCNAPSTVEYTSSQRDLYRTFNNNGYATFLGGFSLNSGGRYNNLSGATIELRGDRTGFAGGGATTNDGLVVKTAGDGSNGPAQYGYNVTNNGMIHLQVGSLDLGWTSSTNNGDILADPGTTLRLLGSHEMIVGSTLTADDVYLSGGPSNVRGDVSITGDTIIAGGTWTFTEEASVADYGQNLMITGGTIHYDAPVAGPIHFDSVLLTPTVGGGTAHFDTGSPVSIGSLLIAPGSLDGADPITVDGSLTFNSGTIWEGGDLTAHGPVTIHSTGGTRNLRRDFYNTDTMTMSNGGLTMANCDMFNLSTGTINMTSDGAKFALTTTATLHNDGLLVKSAGAGTSAIQNHFRNSGTVEVQRGVLEFYTSYNLTYAQTAGQTILNGGNLNVTSPGLFDIQGGDLTGAGTVTGRLANSGGHVKPGMSAGALTVDGDYTQGAAAAYDIEIGGANAGEFDVLTVTGTATLAGELNVALIDGYSPGNGASFVVLTAGAISGTFDSLTGAAGFEVSYTATEVILTSTGSPLPGDLDGDCDVDLADLTVLLAHFGQTSGVGAEDGDIDGDGDVDLADLTLMLSVFGTSC